MKIYSISDLHLSGADPKPMNIFGEHWENHWDRIRDDWRQKVENEDIVLIPGDISWAMLLNNARIDLDEIGELPGKKILVKGNHDYWWSSVSQIRSIIHPSIQVIQNDSVSIDGISFCGTRGWTIPGTKEFGTQDNKIFSRELNRLKLSLESAKKEAPIIVLLHYPPFDDKGRKSQMIEIIEQYPAQHVVFGHLHGECLKNISEGKVDGIEYHLVSCDYLNFKLKLIMEL